MGWASRARYKALAGTKCPTCAYRPGTPASRDEGDELLAATRRALLHACDSFFCHDPRYRFEGSRVLCAGHIDAMNALDKQGFYDVDDEERERRRAYADAMVKERDRRYRASLCVNAIDAFCGESTSADAVDPSAADPGKPAPARERERCR